MLCHHFTLCLLCNSYSSGSPQTQQRKTLRFPPFLWSVTIIPMRLSGNYIRISPSVDSRWLRLLLAPSLLTWYTFPRLSERGLNMTVHHGLIPHASQELLLKNCHKKGGAFNMSWYDVQIRYEKSFFSVYACCFILENTSVRRYFVLSEERKRYLLWVGPLIVFWL